MAKLGGRQGWWGLIRLAAPMGSFLDSPLLCGDDDPRVKGEYDENARAMHPEPFEHRMHWSCATHLILTHDLTRPNTTNFTSNKFTYNTYKI